MGRETDPEFPSAVDRFRDRCAECHAEIVEAYQSSGMSRTWQTVSLPLEGRLDPVPAVIDHLTDYVYQVFQQSDTVFQAERRADLPDHRQVRPAEYLVGSGKHAQAMVTAHNGYLTQLPVAWFREDDAWKLNPGFELRNHRFDRPITSGCVACHATAARHESPTRNRYQLPIEPGIDCGRCHGDDSGHLAYWHGNDSTVRSEAARMLDPGAWSPARANDLCLQCHLQGDITVYSPGHDPLTYLPGEELIAHRHDFLIASGQPEALGVASHGARMLQSRCYLGSSGQLTCIHCHDPHHATERFPREYYDQRCATCHKPADCNRRRAPSELQDPSGCVACHMPQRSSREGIHLVFTDHAILRHRAEGGEDHEPPGVLSPDADVELTSAWPEATPQPGILGAAYVQLHESMGPQTNALNLGKQLLDDAVRHAPDDTQSRFWLAAANLGLQQSSEAVSLLQPIVRADPEHHAARFRLGLAQESSGNISEAMSQYQRLVAEVPSWLEPADRLAQLQLFQNQPQAAERTLRHQLTFQETARAYAQLALARRLQGGDHDAARQLIDRALQLDPLLPTAYVNRGVLHLIEGRHDEARRDFQRVLQLEPANLQARQALEALGSGR